MKQKEFKHEDKTYTLKAMGFFKANRLLLTHVVPLIPSIMSAAQKNKVDDVEGEDKTESLTEILTEILTKLDADSVEKITKQLLDKMTVSDIEFDLDDLDYELLVEAMKEAFLLNYSSLGKLLTRLKKIAPEKASQLEQVPAES